jgi:RNA polymerase sigma-70 factor (ECF subfamily)
VSKLSERVSDGDLARRIGEGPPGAAEAEEAELYRRFAPRVRLYGLRHLRDEAAAQDLVQEVLVVTIERLRAGEVRQPDEIGSFVLGTSRMMAGSLRKRASRRQALDARFGHLSEAVAAPDDAGLDRPRLAGCLHALAERDRVVLLLTFYAERTAPQIAAALGLSPGAVRVVRHRALDRLRACMLRRSA